MSVSEHAAKPSSEHGSRDQARQSCLDGPDSDPMPCGRGPASPTPRANPSPEVTDLICRLPLSTLFYQLEAVHLGDLLRIWVRSGTKITLSPRDFQGPTQVHRTPREARCFTGTTSLSPVKPIPGCPSLTKKRELFPGPAPTSLGSFALPHWTRPEAGQSPCSGSGILTRFPFVRYGHTHNRRIAPFQNGVLLSLRID